MLVIAAVFAVGFIAGCGGDDPVSGAADSAADAAGDAADGAADAAGDAADGAADAAGDAVDGAADAAGDAADGAADAAGDAADAAGDAADAAGDAVTGSTELQVDVATEGLAYAVTELSAPAGEITLNSVNNQAVPHNIAIEGPDGDVLGDVVQDGGVSTITVELPAGEYEYYCSVPGHREGGMVGTLIVE